MTCTTTASMSRSPRHTSFPPLSSADVCPTHRLTNKATIDSSPVSDPTPGDSASDTDTVSTSADLSITKDDRSEERRVGKASRYRWPPYHRRTTTEPARVGGADSSPANPGGCGC